MPHEPTTSTSRLPRWLRGVVLVAAVVYMQVGSFARMGLGMPVGPAFQSWRMYHSRGHEQCKLWAYEHAPGGIITPIDWTERAEWAPGHRNRQVEHERDVARIAKSLCRKTRRENGISLVTQCAADRRWEPPSDTRDLIRCMGFLR